MSGQIIHDVVIPVVAKIMAGEGYINPNRIIDIRDQRFEEFLEEEMRRRFGVIGANGCQHLKEQLDQARKNDPYAFEQLVKKLLEKYVKLEMKMRETDNSKTPEDGPPDRFQALRRKYPLLDIYPQ